MLSAVAAQQIQKQYIKSESSLAIWRVNNSDSTTQKIDLDILTWKHRDVGSISIWYSKELLLEIEKMKNKDLSKETGGCLFGCYDKTSNRIYVFYYCCPLKVFDRNKIRAEFLAWNPALLVTFVFAKYNLSNYEQRYTF